MSHHKYILYHINNEERNEYNTISFTYIVRYDISFNIILLINQSRFPENNQDITRFQA